MKAFACLLLCALLATRTCVAQETVDFGDFMQGLQQWAQSNLDTNVLNALPEVNDATAQTLLVAFQKQYQGEFVIDLAALRDTAKTLLPLLQTNEDTQPYAAWLAAQMDYLDVADELRILVPAPASSSNESNAQPLAMTNPSPQVEREVWTKKVSVRQIPDAAKDYVSELKPVFTAQKVPPELVWVAEVESGFDRRARSPAGAAGPFQLMPDTAKRFGLSLFPFDERYQPEPSATASAQYLKNLYERFHDWRLALAAYNSGEGTVQKLLERYKTQSYDDIATHLPAETQMYVPRVEATLLRREGAKLDELPAPK